MEQMLGSFLCRVCTVFIRFFLALQGELRGVRGLVPSNFLEDLSDPDDVPHHDNSNDSDVTVS